MMVSENKKMIFQAEILVKTIKKFSKGKPTEFTLIIQGSEKTPLRLPLSLVPYRNSFSPYLQRNIEILYTPHFWELGAPCRWFVEPRSPMCVFIDVDVVACSDLSSMYELDRDMVHGVTAFTAHLDDQEWSSIGLTEEDRKNYFNMGMVVVPSKNIKEIGKQLFEVYPRMQKKFPEKAYYSGQVSLSYLLKGMKLKLNTLPAKFNWFDARPYSELDETPIFFHYFWRNNKEPDINKLFVNDGSEYYSIFKKSTSRLNILQ
jgi:hypothetical protein